MRYATKHAPQCPSLAYNPLMGASESFASMTCEISKKSNADFQIHHREFIKISQAVGVGFVVMGAIGYVVKLSTLLRFLSCYIF